MAKYNKGKKKRLYSSGVCVLSVYTLFVCVEKGKHQSQRYVMVYDRIEEEFSVIEKHIETVRERETSL